MLLQITQETNLDKLVSENDWLLKEKLVAKPDQLIKRRGKSGLLLLNSTWAEVTAWINERLGKTLEVTSSAFFLFLFLLFLFFFFLFFFLFLFLD